MSEDTAIRAKAVSQLVERYSLFDDRILIIGCGNGAELYAIRQSGRRQLTVLEDDPETAFRMQRLWPEFERPIDFQLGNLDDLLHKLPANNFALVLIQERQPEARLVARLSNNIIVIVDNDPTPYRKVGYRELCSQMPLPDGRSASIFQRPLGMQQT